MAKAPKKNKTPRPVAKSFQATLERMGGRLRWVIIHIPFDAAKTWGTRGQIRVKGAINGFSFRTSLFPTGTGGHMLLVNKQMQKGGRALPGHVARFQLEPDTEERVVTIPAELNLFLSQERSLRRWFEKLSHSTRWWIGKWISDPKSPVARQRRAEQIAERLLETMEAEQELPPILKVAFARNPRAREGWERMSPSRRRAHLLGVFYYRTPEGRANRIAKMLEDALAIAEKNARRP